jgi:hypothetical protein
VRKPSVDPAFTFGVSLIVSLALWLPTLLGTMAGNIDITDAGIRYFLALAISWAGVYGICALVAMYASQPRRPGPPATEHPLRRREDPADAAPHEDKETPAA